MREGDEDYTGRIGPMFEPGGHDGPDWPMYSFSRPAFEFWNGFANELRARGFGEEQIREELQSVGVRWMLDEWGEEVGGLGRRLAGRYASNYRKFRR